MRKIIGVTIASLLFIAGLFSTGYLLFFASVWLGIMVVGSGFVAALGACWLYEDLFKGS